MKYSALRKSHQWAVALTLLLLNGLAGLDSHASPQNATVQYFATNDPSQTGIGFLADGRSLFVGGCQPFDLVSLVIPKGCRYPPSIRWATVSPDGSLLFATALNAKTGQTRSMQINAVSGQVISARKGIYFAPPIAVHPSNAYWAAVVAGKVASASETVSLVDRSWKVRKSQIYAETRRIFSLNFDAAGRTLLVNGGGPIDGVSLDTEAWKPVSPTTEDSSTEVLLVSSNGMFGVSQNGERLVVFEVSSKRVIAELGLDTTRSEPEMAFAADSTMFAAKGLFIRDGQCTFGFALLTL